MRLNNLLQAKGLYSHVTQDAHPVNAPGHETRWIHIYYSMSKRFIIRHLLLIKQHSRA